MDWFLLLDLLYLIGLVVVFGGLGFAVCYAADEFLKQHRR